MSTGFDTDQGVEQNISDGFLSTIPDGSTIPEDVWERRHRYFIIAVLAHIPVLLGLGLLEGNESITGMSFPSIPLGMLLLELGAIAAFEFVAAVPGLNRRLRTVLAVTGLAFASGVLVHVSGGYIEAHFHFFVAIGIAAIYEDWLPFGVGIGYVVITHIGFGLVDPSRVYNHTAAQLNPWVWGFIHGAFVTLLAMALTIHLSSIETSRRQAQQELKRARDRANRIDDLEERKAAVEQEREEAERLKAEAEQQRKEVEELNSHLELKASSYQRTLEQAADGDLSVRVDTDSQSEAMAAIGVAVNDMLADIEGTVAEIQTFATEVQQRAEDVSTSTQQAATASDDISHSVQDIAAGTDEQRQMLDSVSNEMADLSATIEEVASSSQEVAQLSDETIGVATDGLDLADKMIADAEAVQESITTTAETAGELNTQMEEISEVTDLIADIAEQTNMLALNASIEAARAGQGESDGGRDGDGFAVVADEVKQLAEETQASASEIQEQVATGLDKTSRVVDEVTEANELMEEELAAVQEVANAFERVVENARETDAGVQEISQSTDSQAASGEEVASVVEEVSEISDRSADEAGDVSAAVEEQTASMNEVDTTMSAVAEQATELTNLLSAFVVNTDAGSHTTTGSEPGMAPTDD